MTDEPDNEEPDLFDDELGPVDWYGRAQWEESRMVVERAHAAERERNRHFSGVEVFIPSGLHLMLAYIEYKAGNITEAYWRNYVQAYPKSFTGSRSVRARVADRIRRSVHNYLMTHLHWLAVGEHPALIPLKPVPRRADEAHSPLADDLIYLKTIDLVRDTLKVLISGSSLSSVEAVIASLDGSLRYIESRESIRSVIRCAHLAAAREDERDEEDDDVPF